MVQDARYRILLALNTYMLAANMLRQDAATALQYHVMFDDGIIPLKKMMAGSGASEKNLDVLYSLGQPSSTPTWNFEHKTAYYTENVPATVYAVDPINRLEGTKTLSTAHQELRRVLESNFGGSLGVLRRMPSEQPNTEDKGGWKLYSIKANIEYQRINSNYLPTYPAFSHTIAYTYEGDRLTGGAEGTWTLSQGAGSTCTQTITSDKNLYLNQTVFAADSSTVNGTNLGLSSTAYGRIRIRYKTTGNATAKVILGFSAGTQTVLAETASSGFTVVDVAITTAKTINTITLYCCDGTGTVTYDFVQIYAGTYVIPICLKIDPPQTLKDSVIKMPGMSGNVTQGLGSDLIEVSMDCYLDMEYYLESSSTYLTWKRPQTVAPASKTDYNNTDVFTELQHVMGINTAWTWLDLGYPAMQFKARLFDMHPSYSGEKGVITLVWREYRHGSAAGESAVERYGMSL